MNRSLKLIVVSLALLVSGVLVSPSAQVQIQRGWSTVNEFLQWPLGTKIYEDAANILALRNGLNGQALRLYDLYVSEVDHTGWELNADTAGSFLLRYRNNGVLSTVGTFTSGGQLNIGTVESSGNGLFASGTVQANGDAGLEFPGKARLRAPSPGVLRVLNPNADNAYDITLADWGTILSPEGVSLANGSVTFLGASRLGNLRITTNQNFFCSYFLRGSTNATVEITDIGGACTITKDNAATYNIYYDAAGASGAGYYLQVLAVTSTVYIMFDGV